MVDDNEFFREITLRLCSHLEIEEGLRDCIKYLSRYMPADGLYLERHESNLSVRFVARANGDRGEKMDVQVHRGEPLRFDDLGVTLTNRAPSGEDGLDLDAVIASHIRRVLGMTSGKIHGPDGAGELLGMNPNTLRAKMKKLGIPFRKHLR